MVLVDLTFNKSSLGNTHTFENYYIVCSLNYCCPFCPLPGNSFPCFLFFRILARSASIEFSNFWNTHSELRNALALCTSSVLVLCSKMVLQAKFLFMFAYFLKNGSCIVISSYSLMFCVGFYNKNRNILIIPLGGGNVKLLSKIYLAIWKGLRSLLPILPYLGSGIVHGPVQQKLSLLLLKWQAPQYHSCGK